MNNLNRYEKAWMYGFSGIILLATLYFSAAGTDYKSWTSVLLNWVVSPVSALTGVLCVVLCAKGHISNVWWGVVNSVTYGLVAWVSGYYGDWMLNWFFFVPTQAFIYWQWRKNLNRQGIVKMKRLTMPQTYWLGIVTVAATYFFALYLVSVDNFFTKAFERNSTLYGNLTAIINIPLLGPILDASTVVLQVVAEVMLILMYAEQWPLWIATNVITSAIWCIVIWTDPTSIPYAVPTLIMWLAFLVNSIYGTTVWYKASRK